MVGLLARMGGHQLALVTSSYAAIGQDRLYKMQGMANLQSSDLEARDGRPKAWLT
jgi:hypothetical protein